MKGPLSSSQSMKRRKLNHEGATIKNVDANYYIDVPIITSQNEIMKKYQEKYVVLYRPSNNNNRVNKMDLNLNTVAAVFKDSNDKIKKSFCVENSGNGTDLNEKIVFDSKSDNKYDKWYASFIAQHDEKLLNKLNTKLLPIPFIDTNVFHSDIIWFFIGKNIDQTCPLEGRAEHTDSVTHDGTWHYQCSGEKIWEIRPTQKLINNIINNNSKKKKMMNSNNNNNNNNNDTKQDHLTMDNKMIIKCQAGDILLINTKLWWHHTKIPPTNNANHQVSISYARDIYFESNKPTNTNLNNMTNVDAVYASKSIKAGNVVLTEDDMPDCELPRSNDPNCAVTMLDNGQGALIAIKNIDEGDFFSIANSSSSDDDDLDDEEEVEDVD
jgi:hypothetical protein